MRIKQHLIAGPVIAILAFSASVLISWDRRAPLEYLGGEIIGVATRGAEIIVRRHVIWHRPCQGQVSSEVVGADGIIRAYAKRYTRIPIQLGDQHTEIPMTMPGALPPPKAKYKVVLRFYGCGFTSHWWPIEVVAPELEITVQ